MPSSSEVCGFTATSGSAGSAGALVADVLSLSPTTEMALPPTVTGTVTDTMPCVPDAAPSLPSVLASDSPEALPLGADAAASLVEESPRTEMALPPTVMGTSMLGRIWVPESRPSSPAVSAAWAIPAPARAIPPPTTTPRSARLMNVRMRNFS